MPIAEIINTPCFHNSQLAPTQAAATNPLTQLFEQRAWKKTIDDPQRLDIQGKLVPLSQNSFIAAKVALTLNLHPHTNLGNIDAALSLFKTFDEHLHHCALTGGNVTFAEAQNVPETTLTPSDANRILQNDLYLHTCKLATLCSKLKKMLEQEKEGIDPTKMQSIREEISQALQSDAYAFLSTHPDQDVFAKFLQHLSFQINTQAEGMQVVEEIGTEALSNYCELNITDTQTVSTQDIAQWTETIFANIPEDNWDSAINFVIWALKNFARAFCAFIDTHFPGYHYNSYAHGNANMWIGDFEVDGKKVRFNLGPSPTSDSLFAAQLKWEEKQGIPHLQHTLECNHPQGERTRLERMRDLAKEQENLTMIGTPLDGKIWNGEGEFSQIASVAAFHENLKNELLGKKHIPEQIKDYNGFANSLLEEADIEETITASKKAFEHLVLPEELNLDAKKNERLSRAMLLGFTGFLVLKTLMKFPEKMNNPAALAEEIAATMGQACKQDVDRGPIVNALTIAYIQMINSGELNGKDAKQIIGMVLMRALMVDERLMTKPRLEAFLDLFALIGRNESGFVQELRALVPTGAIKFIPSNTHL